MAIAKNSAQRISANIQEIFLIGAKNKLYWISKLAKKNFIDSQFIPFEATFGFLFVCLLPKQNKSYGIKDLITFLSGGDRGGGGGRV